MNVIQSGGGGSAKKWQKYVDVGIGGNGRQTMVMKAIVSKMLKMIIGGQWKQGEAAAVDT